LEVDRKTGNCSLDKSPALGMSTSSRHIKVLQSSLASVSQLNFFYKILKQLTQGFSFEVVHHDDSLWESREY
jgi:hypothetical protein